MAPFLLSSMSRLARSCRSAMAARKRRRRVLAATKIPTLPADVLLETVARTNLFTLVHCAAVCKHLLCDILSTPFIRRVSQQLAPSILAHLCTFNKKLLTLVHPVTPAAASFCDERLSPSMSRCHAKLLHDHTPVASRHGLVVLDRMPLIVQGKSNYLHEIMRPESERNFDLCVYDPMTGQHTFLSKPPGIQSGRTTSQKYVLLTPVDGIDDSFMLLFANKSGWSINVHVTTSSSSTWEPINTQARHHDIPWWSANMRTDPAVLHGGGLHWLTHLGDRIISYDVSTGKSGLMKPPPTNHKASQVHLATSSEGNLLKLLTIEGFKISVWLQLPITPKDTGGSDWSLENVIDMKEKIWFVCPNIPLGGVTDVFIEFQGSGKRSGDVMLMRVNKKNHCSTLVVFDLETNEMHIHKGGSMLLEIDLSWCLQTMKVFP